MMQSICYQFYKIVFFTKQCIFDKRIKWTEKVQAIGLLVTLYFLVKSEADTKVQLEKLGSLASEGISQTQILSKQLQYFEEQMQLSHQQNKIMYDEYLLKIKPLLNVELFYSQDEQLGISIFNDGGDVFHLNLLIKGKGNCNNLKDFRRMIPAKKNIDFYIYGVNCNLVHSFTLTYSDREENHYRQKCYFKDGILVSDPMEYINF